MHVILSLILYLMTIHSLESDGQSCGNMVNTHQQGDNQLNANSQVMIPRSSISCDHGRLTGYLVSLNQDNTGHNYPHIQMWRPSFTHRSGYKQINDYVLTENDIIKMGNYYFANVSFAMNETMQLHFGDFIGYYQPPCPRYTVWSINTTSYVSFNITTEEYRDFVITKSILNYINDSQPLIQVLYDVQCTNILPAPANGEILSCSSGRVGVGYEGDTCSFTCNTGYELTGSGTRTCQSDGSWSGSDDVCRRVWCSSLTKPDNGTISCTLKDDGVSSYEDTCSFTCNTGYELTGSTERTCQSDGSWSGLPVSCIIMECSSSSLPMNSMLAESCSSTYQSMCELQCQEGFIGTGDPLYVCDVLSNGSSVLWMIAETTVSWRCQKVCCVPLNGQVDCGSGLVNLVLQGDNCTFSCDPGYMLLESVTSGKCESNGSWSGGLPSCVPHNCSDLPVVANTRAPLSCDLTYQSQCTVSCDEGFTGDDFTYLCNVTSNATMVDWVPIGERNVMCERVRCPAPMNGTLQCSNGATTGVFEDTCTFSCNAGYELQGSNNGTCLANQSWSGGDPICVALNCSTPLPLNNSQLQSSCDTQYRSTCTTVCVDGYTGVGGSYTCVVTDVDTNRVGWNGSTSCQRNSGSDTIKEDYYSPYVYGAVFFVILIILICFIIFLICCCTRKKRKCINSSESVKPSEDQVHSHNLAVWNVTYEPNELRGRVKYENFPNPSDAVTNGHHIAISDKPVAYTYLEPQSFTNSCDGNAMSNGHEQLQRNESARSSSQNKTVHAYQQLSDFKQFYKDPGQKKKAIYAWIKKNKIFKFDKRAIRILHEIGSGEFGTVYLGLWSNGSTDPVQVAVKTLKPKCSESDRVKFLREAAIMGQFVHNNVVQLHGVVTEEENMMIVLEYMPKGDLLNQLLKMNSIPTKLQLQDPNSELHYELLSYCRQIASGMNYLTNKCFVHRDLAARNILLSSENVCKIADFGMARDVTSDIYYITKGGRIPVKWTAPEAIFYKKYSVKSDVWSFGCVMYEIWSLGHRPFEDLSPKECAEEIMTGYRLPPPPGCPRAIYELMIQCWHPEAKGRPDSKVILTMLQKSDDVLLQCPVHTGDKTDSQVTMLGAPLINGEQLYPDLQSSYRTRVTYI